MDLRQMELQIRPLDAKCVCSAEWMPSENLDGSYVMQHKFDCEYLAALDKEMEND